MTPSELLALVDDRLPLDSRTYPTLDDYSAALQTLREHDLRHASPPHVLDRWTIEVFHHDWHPLIDHTDPERYLFRSAHEIARREGTEPDGYEEWW